MSCIFTEKISSLIDGELATAEAREVERHLVSCDECEQLRADFLNLRSQITSFESSLTSEVHNRALKKILAPRTSRSGSWAAMEFRHSNCRLCNAAYRRGNHWVDFLSKQEDATSRVVGHLGTVTSAVCFS